MKYLTFTRGPKFKGKNLKGLLPEFPGVEAPGWNVCVADAKQKNRWVAITSDGKSCKQPSWVVVKEGGRRNDVGRKRDGLAGLPRPALRWRLWAVSRRCDAPQAAERRCRRSRPRAASRWSSFRPAPSRWAAGTAARRRQPVHKVWIDAFLMDRHEVTQAEYEKLGKIEAFPNPSHFQGAGPAGGTGHLAAGGPLLQRPVAPRGTPAVLQRGHRRV